MNKVYLSKERLEELKRELTELKTRGRLEIAERLKRAKELGDLSENSEYMEAREAQNQLETKIGELEENIRNSEIIQKPAKGEVVKIGATIKVEKNGNVLSYTIVGSSEAEPEKGFISNESPVGQALLDKKTGDSVTVKTPKGETRYKVLAIE